MKITIKLKDLNKAIQESRELYRKYDDEYKKLRSKYNLTDEERDRKFKCLHLATKYHCKQQVLSDLRRGVL